MDGTNLKASEEHDPAFFFPSSDVDEEGSCLIGGGVFEDFVRWGDPFERKLGHLLLAGSDGESLAFAAAM